MNLWDKSERRSFDQAACFVEDEGVVIRSIVAIEDRRVVGSEKPPARSELYYNKYTTLALHIQANWRRILKMTAPR